VKAMVAVAEKFDDFHKIIGLSEKYKNFIVPALGLHPVKPGSHDTESRSVTLEDYQMAETFLREHHNILVAIGEVGLDFTPYNVKSSNDKEVQRNIFRKQIQLAREFGLPLNVHSRSAGRPTIQTLISEGATAVLLHAFDGKVSVARQGVEAGFYFSVPPSVIRSEQKQRLVRSIPLSNLLLETDAPALGPEKQIRNEAKNIEISCQEIARIKNISVDEVKESTTANALRLFPRLTNLYNICDDVTYNF
ncbi:uncharacterized protein TRIADDRAFT_18433, partial [Trichoplax adhaerens]